jgi:hypothetical protein
MDQMIERLDEVPVDENGVDLSLIDLCLSLTPTERLRQAQGAAQSVLTMRKAITREIDPWKTLDYLIGWDCSES